MTALPMARSVDRDEGFADDRLMRNAHARPFAIVERDQRPPVQVSHDEAARAVDRIDDPGQSRLSMHAAMLFAVNAVIGIATRDRYAYHRFGGAIGFGHGIVAARTALVLDVEGRTKMRQ